VAYHPTYVSGGGGSSDTSDTGGSWWDRWGCVVIVGGVAGVIVLVGIISAAKGDPPVSAAYSPTAVPSPVAGPPPVSAEKVLVRVVAVHSGEAPDWVRQAWVGLVLPAIDNRVFRGQEVLSGRRSFAPAYQVNSTIALSLLEIGNQRAAADWWRQNVPDTDTPGQHFLFSPECCAPL
jgi:hypothetical protein